MAATHPSWRSRCTTPPRPASTSRVSLEWVSRAASRGHALNVRQQAPDAVGHASRLLASRDLDGEACDDLMPTATDVGDLHDLRIAPQPSSDHDGSGKADLVPAVVDSELEAAPLAQVFA